MMGLIFKLTGEEYLVIEAEFDSIEASDKNPEEKMKELRVLAASMTEKLLSILLPDGATDLPVLPGIRWGAWFMIKSKIVPDMLIDLMRQARQLQALPLADSFIGYENTKAAALISSKVGDLIGTQGLGLIA
jgi:hypothetical protein